MRIVSLVPSATEMLCDLGLQASLVAVSHACDYPASIQELPRITKSIVPEGLEPTQIDAAVVRAMREHKPLYQVNGDLLAALQPDLIVTQGVCDVCAVNTGTVEATLRLLPDVLEVPTLVLTGKTFEGILRNLRLMGEMTETKTLAEERADLYHQRWLSLSAHKPKRSPRVLMLEWSDPPYYGGHWVPQMVEAAGGINVLGEVGFDSKRTTWQAIGFADPDIICVMCCGYGLADNVRFAKQLYKQTELKYLRAIRHHHLWAFDANRYFSRPTPGIVHGAEVLQKVFMGDEPNVDVQRVTATSLKLV
ncbi:MAG: cobalamin-binding protein [Trueperaceae bacterium]